VEVAADESDVESAETYIGYERATNFASAVEVARDLHLVLGPDAAIKPVRFRVMIDGHEPGQDHGADTDEHGNGTVHERRLYQLIRQSGAKNDRTFTIEFQDAGVLAYAFTFG
jgi:hypothetical protein